MTVRDDTELASRLRFALIPLVRLLRPEFGLLPHGFSRNAVASQFWSLFCDRDLIDPEVAELMVDEFRRIYHSPGARLAFLASARKQPSNSWKHTARSTICSKHVSQMP